jgi:hypothetical protein
LKSLEKIVDQNFPDYFESNEEENYLSELLESNITDGNLYIVKFLIEVKKLSIYEEFPNRDHNNNLTYQLTGQDLAAMNDHLDILKYFIDKGETPYIHTLDYSITYHSIDIVKYLFSVDILNDEKKLNKKDKKNILDPLKYLLRKGTTQFYTNEYSKDFNELINYWIKLNPPTNEYLQFIINNFNYVTTKDRNKVIENIKNPDKKLLDEIDKLIEKQDLDLLLEEKYLNETN